MRQSAPQGLLGLATEWPGDETRCARKDIDHLPLVQQDELTRATQTLMDAFSVAIARATQPWKKNGRIQKIILFGSYARDDWVDEPENGYQSDYDLLIIVNHPDLTDIAEYWYVAEDKMLRDPAIRRPVNIIVHTLDEVNHGLMRGEYFWLDIVRDGIAIYELPGAVLASRNHSRRAMRTRWRAATSKTGWPKSIAESNLHHMHLSKKK